MIAKTRLGQVVAINPDSVTQDFPHREIEYIEISSVGSGTLDGTRTIAIDEAPSRAKRLVKDGDTILSTVRPNRRSFLFIKNPLPNTVVSTGFAVLRASGAIDNRFLYYVVNHQPFTDYLTARAKGAAYPAVDTDTIADAEITLPPLPIQRKIAGILSAYDDLIENNTRRIKILEEMAQRINREWFVDFRYPGHENYKLVESELGMIPEGWEIIRLGDIAQEVRRSVNPIDLDPGTPHFGLEHLPRKSIALANWGYADEVQSAKLAFKKGEILFGKIRPYFHKVGVAPLDGICSTDTIVITCKEPVHKSIVLGCVSSDDFVNHATQTSQGTKMPRANWAVLVEYPVLIPVENVLCAFDEFMQSVVDQIINHIFRNRTLRQTRDLLLPKLISGKIDVSELVIETGEGKNNAA